MSATLWLVLLLSTPPAGGQEQIVQGEGVIARLHAAAALTGGLQVSLSGELVLTVTVESAAGIEVAALPLITRTPGWRQRFAVEGWETSTLEDGRVRRQQTYRLSPWTLGEAPVLLAPVRYRTDRTMGVWEELTWKPLAVLVTTEVRTPDLGEARGVTGMETLPPEEPSRTEPLVVAGVLSGLALAAAGFLIRHRRRRPTPPRPADEVALLELTHLLEGSIPATERASEAFVGRLSELLRNYLEARFGMHAPRQTTAEFLAAARGSPHLNESQRTVLGSILERCDLAKFACTSVSPEEFRQLLADARAWIIATRPGD